MSDEHSDDDFKNPITGLTRTETDAKFTPLYEGFVTSTENLLSKDEYKGLNIAEGMDQGSSDALLRLLRTEIPKCCSGHTFESLMEIVNMFALTNMVCKSSDCPEEINHQFIDEFVELFQKLGEDMENALTSA